ncbi:MAG: ribose 5-phosphate isomerase B [Chthonomonas sp.]|nr:ribose 5-phosphate isomerase B [Chthonomonas sp.]
MRLALGSDHAGYVLRAQLQVVAAAEGHSVLTFGATSEESFDYPIAADGVCRSVLDGQADLGIVICGSGIGVSIRANRYPGIRCALCTSVQMAELARMHNHANVLALGQRTTDPELAAEIMRAFLTTSPDHGERHERRIRQLDAGCS